MRTGELTQKILSHYGVAVGNGEAKYIALTQVRAATGWADPSTADVMIMGNWPSTGCKLDGFEVKISRADWLNEVKSPGKATPTKKYCDRWWLAVSDQAFVQEGELPDDWGMMAVVSGKLKVIKQAPQLSPQPMDNMFVASMLRSDNKDQIPVDVHNEKLKDAVRDAEQKMKTKYADLMAYVRELNKAFGIKLTFKEEREYLGQPKSYTGKWVAEVRGRFGGYRTHSDEQVQELIRSAINQDLEDLDWKMKQIKDYARQILEGRK